MPSSLNRKWRFGSPNGELRIGFSMVTCGIVQQLGRFHGEDGTLDFLKYLVAKSMLLLNSHRSLRYDLTFQSVSELSTMKRSEAERVGMRALKVESPPPPCYASHHGCRIACSRNALGHAPRT